MDESACTAKKNNLSTVFAGHAVGLKEVEDGTWLVSFMDYDLGYIDLEGKLSSPSTALSGQKCYLCLRYVLLPMCPGRTIDCVAEGVGFEPTRPFRA
jgi:hypothetical protein